MDWVGSCIDYSEIITFDVSYTCDYIFPLSMPARLMILTTVIPIVSGESLRRGVLDQ